MAACFRFRRGWAEGPEQESLRRAEDQRKRGARFMRLNHVALTVADREHSAAFYARYFGMSERIHEDDHLLILASASGCLLALSVGEPAVDVPRTTHFGFQCDSLDEVLQARTRFSDDGIVEAEWQEQGPTRVQVFDPDGYRVELYAF